MAATELLAAGDTAANSPDFTVGQGESATICLKGVTEDDGEVSITLKDDEGGYTVIGRLFYTRNGGQKAICITAPGTYRVSRPAGKKCGVFRA